MYPKHHIQVNISSPGIQVNAQLQPEALAELISLVQKYRVEAPVVPPAGPTGAPPEPGAFWGEIRGRQRQLGRELNRAVRRIIAGHGGSPPPASDLPVPELSPEATAIRQQMAALEFDQIRLLMPQLTFGDKLMLLVAWEEARTKTPVHKMRFKQLFAMTGEIGPANGNRDLKQRLTLGYMLKDEIARCLSMTETGWIRISQIIFGDEPPGAAVVA